ncbi:MAG: neutral zinc metallopeptidase [Microcystaceae cyanobacterium]
MFNFFSKKAIALLLLTGLFTNAIAQPVTAEWDAATLSTVSDSLDVFWASFLRQFRIRYRYPVVYTHRRTERTPCGPSSLAHYCPQNNSIHLNIPQLTRLARQSGDVAAYYAVAHEYGHSVQNHFGLFNRRIPVVKLELQADCFAGIFFAAADNAGALEPGDLEEGVFAAKISGDYEYNDPQHHGTPKQRVNAFLKGFRNPKSCF